MDTGLKNRLAAARLVRKVRERLQLGFSPTSSLKPDREGGDGVELCPPSDPSAVAWDFFGALEMESSPNDVDAVLWCVLHALDEQSWVEGPSKLFSVWLDSNPRKVDVLALLNRAENALRVRPLGFVGGLPPP